MTNENKQKTKKLTEKQMKALELLTSGKGMTYQAIAAEVGVDKKQIWRWRNEPQFAHFQEALQKLDDEKWFATVEAAREAALRLCMDGKTEMVKFVLQNAGYNPSQKIEAEVNTDIVINIGEDE